MPRRRWLLAMTKGVGNTVLPLAGAKPILRPARPVWAAGWQLEGVQPAVHAHTDVVVAPVLSVTSDLAHDLGQFIVVGEDGTAISIATKRLAGEKTGASDG